MVVRDVEREDIEFISTTCCHLTCYVTCHVTLLQAKAKKIMVVRDVEREDIEFISKTLGCLP
jgi:hypothetical protein